MELSEWIIPLWGKKREEKENKPASLLSADVSDSKHLHLKVFEHL